MAISITTTRATINMFAVSGTCLESADMNVQTDANLEKGESFYEAPPHAAGSLLPFASADG